MTGDVDDRIPGMTVLCVIDSLAGGGAETSLVDLAQPLRNRGISLVVATFRPDDGILQTRLSDQAVPVHRLDGFPYSPLSFRRLRKVVKQVEPNLVHTTLPQADITGRVSTIGLAVPVVSSWVNADYGPEHRANSSYPSVVVRALQLADRVTVRRTRRFHAISTEVADVMSRRLGVARTQVDVISRARSEDRLGRWSDERRRETRNRLAIPLDTPVVLACGRLDRQKAVDVTIRAFGLVRRVHPDALLLVCGRPGNAQLAIDRARGQFPEGVRFLGHREDIPDLMCASDVLAFPSRWEGLGGTLLEAMKLRLPIVATKIGPVMEAVGPTAAALVPVDDAEALGVSLAEVLSRPELVQDNLNRAEARYDERNSMACIADQMAAWYRANSLAARSDILDAVAS
jgi:glycosyltransferase involved in cell wall biosynthesis